MSTQGLWIWSMPTFSFFQCHLSTTSVLERRAAKRFVLYTPATAISDNALFLINGLETCKATNAADKPSSARSRSLVSLPKHLGNLQPWPYLWSPDPNYLMTSIFCWQEGMRDISLWSKPTDLKTRVLHGVLRLLQVQNHTFQLCSRVSTVLYT